MADKKRRGGGSELSRSATVTVRLDPKLRYLAGLAARKQRRTLSSFIEWSIEESLKHVALRDYDEHGKDSAPISGQAEKLWDVDEADRFVKLAMSYPELLNHHEQVVWKLVRENGHLWRGKEDKAGVWQWQTSPNKFIPERLREHWETFNKIARGEVSRLALPRWPGMPKIDVSDFEFDLSD